MYFNIAAWLNFKQYLIPGEFCVCAGSQIILLGCFLLYLKELHIFVDKLLEVDYTVF